MREPVEGSAEAQDVSAPSPPRSDDERAVAVLLREALDDPHLDDDQVDRWVGVAVSRSTARRRRRRLMGSAVLTACCAVAVTALVTAPLGSGAPEPAPSPQRQDQPDDGAIARPGTIRPSADARGVPLSTAEVAAVVPGAEPLLKGPYRPEPPISAPGDACGGAALPGAAVPVHAAYAQWGVGADGGGARVMVATANSWARADDVTAYASALRASLPSCEAAAAPDQPVVPIPGADDGTTFTTAYSEGAWNVTALAVEGTSSVLLTGWVPGPHTDAGARAAGRALAQLAATAVERVAG